MTISRVIATFLSVSFVGLASAGDPKAGADVVGRDLAKTVWPFNNFGHVAIWTGANVLEVLNEGTVKISTKVEIHWWR